MRLQMDMGRLQASSDETVSWREDATRRAEAHASSLDEVVARVEWMQRDGVMREEAAEESAKAHDAKAKRLQAEYTAVETSAGAAQVNIMQLQVEVAELHQQAQRREESLRQQR